MAIQHTIMADRHLLRARAWGFDENLQQVQAYGMAVLTGAIENQCTQIICDETELVYTLSTLDTFELAQLVSRLAPRVGRVAIVVNPKQIRDARFWETVAVNRGASVRVFPTTDAAEEWLAE